MSRCLKRPSAEGSKRRTCRREGTAVSRHRCRLGEAATERVPLQPSQPNYRFLPLPLTPLSLFYSSLPPLSSLLPLRFFSFFYLRFLCAPSLPTGKLQAARMKRGMPRHGSGASQADHKTNKRKATIRSADARARKTNGFLSEMKSLRCSTLGDTYTES